MTFITTPPQLCLVVETIPGASERCAAALKAAPVATLIVAPGPGGSIDRKEAVALIALAHAQNTAALVEDDAALAKALSADGVHISWQDDVETAYAAARASLGPNAIIGVDAGHSGHGAMSLGESGADYIAFGLGAGERDLSENERLELVEWWAEIFEIPVVAFDVETADEAARLTEAGADFVSGRIPSTLAPEQVSLWLSGIAQGLETRLPAG
jgi:thiamine-phosphate pyrophosphorylase